MATPLRQSDILRDERSEVIETGELVPIGQPAREAYKILHFGMVVIPIVAGVDKYFDVLTNWDQYLASPISASVGITAHQFMMISGTIEVVVGLGLAVAPRAFSYIFAAWMIAVIANLLLTGNFYDVALYDFGLMLGAVALGRLSLQFAPVPRRRLQAVQ
jgi:hypothetical protein